MYPHNCCYEKKCQTCVSRRQILTNSIKIPFALSLSGFFLNFLSSCAPAGGGSAAAPAAGTYEFLFSAHPELNQSGNGTKLVSLGTIPAVIARFGNNAYTVSGTCTHAQLAMATYSGDEATGYFPCNLTTGHGSRFNKAGVVTVGPATANLTTYVTTVTATGIVVTV